MKDFRLRNDTVLLFKNEPTDDITKLAAGKKVLFVYGGESARRNGCFEDVKKAVSAGKGELFELGGASCELRDIERGLELVKQHEIEMIIGAGGASIMDWGRFPRMKGQGTLALPLVFRQTGTGKGRKLCL